MVMRRLRWEGGPRTAGHGGDYAGTGANKNKENVRDDVVDARPPFLSHTHVMKNHGEHTAARKKEK